MVLVVTVKPVSLVVLVVLWYCWRCRPEARLVMRSSFWPPRTLYVEAATQCNELSQVRAQGMRSEDSQSSKVQR